jgi:hypothetical protein
MKTRHWARGICAQCGKYMETEIRHPRHFAGHGRRKSFCSDRCRQRAHRAQLSLQFGHDRAVKAAKTMVSEVMSPIRLKNKTVKTEL